MTVWSRIAAARRQASPAADDRGLGRARPDRQNARRRRARSPTAGTRRSPSGGLATVLIRTPYGRTIMGPLGRLYAERGYQVDRAELPRHVRLRWRVRPGAQRAGRRAGHARMGGGPALVRRPPRHVGRQLPRHDAVGRGAGRAGLPAGAQPPGDGIELPRLRRVPRRRLRARDGAGLAARDQEPGARVADRAAHPPAGRPGGVDVERGPAPREVRQRRHRRAHGLLPGLARAQHPGDPWWDGVDFGRRLEQGAAGQLHRRLVRPLPPGAGGRLRGAPRAPGARPA